MRSFILSVSRFWLLCAIAIAQQKPSASPTLHTSVELVQVNVSVHGKQGAAGDLKKSDFIVLDQGKEREISVFLSEAGSGLIEKPEALPPDTFSNVPQYGLARPRSVTVVLLDNLNTLYGSGSEPYENSPTWLEDHALANAKEHLLGFIKGLSSNGSCCDIRLE
jgi:hypothetical protein